MKQLIILTLFTSCSYTALANMHTTPEEPSTLEKQQEPKKINASQMTLPFFNLFVSPAKNDSLKEEGRAIHSAPTIIDPRSFEYRISEPKTIY